MAKHDFFLPASGQPFVVEDSITTDYQAVLTSGASLRTTLDRAVLWQKYMDMHLAITSLMLGGDVYDDPNIEDPNASCWIDREGNGGRFPSRSQGKGYASLSLDPKQANSGGVRPVTNTSNLTTTPSNLHAAQGILPVCVCVRCPDTHLHPKPMGKHR